MDGSERLMFEGWATLPQFKKKIEQAKTIIKEALAIAPAYVAISWGKDSIVLLHLVQQIQPDILAISFGHPERNLITNYAEVEQLYCNCFSPNLTTIEIAGDHIPNKVRQVKLWETYPVAFIGLRKEESSRRRLSLCKYGAIHQYQSRGWRVCPLSDWKENDVWAYIVSNNLPYLQSYDLGAKRTTDHVSKSSKRDYQASRLEEFKKIAPEYYQYLQINFPETFYAAN